MSCERCADWNNGMPIATPQALRALLQALQTAVHNGLLQEVLAPDAPDYEEQVSVRTLIEDAWPDVFALHLACRACGQGFCLACETYNGWGGSWEAVPAASP